MHPYPQLPVAENRTWASAVECWGGSLPPEAQQWNRDSTLGGDQNPEALKAHARVGEAGRDKPRELQAGETPTPTKMFSSQG